MKKVTKLTTATFVALSALTPVAAFASEDTATQGPAAGIYTDTGYFTSLAELSKSEVKTLLKGALRGNAGLVIVTADGTVYDVNKENALLVLTAENLEELSDIAQSYEQYQEATGKELGEDGIKDRDDNLPVDVTVESVSAINKTTVEVKFSAEVDAVNASNFTIQGGTVTSATLAEDNKTVKLAVSGLAYDTTYELVATGILANGETTDLPAKSFKTPAVSDLWTLSVSTEANSVVADGADNAVIKFELLDAEGNVDKAADNVVLTIDATFGNLANSRVTIQDGIGQVVLASEFSTKSEVSKITAQIIEASGDYKELIGKVAGEATVNFVPSGAETDVDAVTFLDAESNQADRVTLYFDKAVAPSTFVKTTTSGKFVTEDVKNLSDEVVYTKQVTKNNVEFTIVQDGVERDIIGFRSVAGNEKAIEAILAKVKATGANNQLTDNAEVTVKAKLGTTNNEDTFVLTDARQPEITSISPEGLDTLKLKFSESVAIGTFKIDGIWSEGKEFDVEYGEFDAKTGIDYRDTAEIKLAKYAADTEGHTSANNDQQRYFEAGSHSLTVTQLKDFAGITDAANVSTSQTLGFNIVADTTAPKAEVTVESPEQFRVKFDKKVNYSSTENYLNDLFTNALEIYDVEAKKYVPVSDHVGSPGAGEIFKATPEFKVDVHGNELVVELTEDWTNLLEDSTDAYYNYKFRFNIEADSFSNATNGVKNAVITLDLNKAGSPLNTADNLSPKIESISETDNDAVFKVTMTEPVKLTDAAGDGLDTAGDTIASSQTNGLPTVQVEFQGKDKDGKSVVIAGTVQDYSAGQKGADSAFDVKTDGTNLQALVDAGYSQNWTVVVKSISDDIGNTAATLTKDFVVAPTEAGESVFQIKATQNGYSSHEVVAYDTNDATKHDRIEITFTKGVVNTGGASDLTMAANWTLNGQKLANVASITVRDENNDSKDGYETVIITFNDERALKSSSNTIAVNKSVLSKDGTKLTGKNEIVATTIDVDLLLTTASGLVTDAEGLAQALAGDGTDSQADINAAQDAIDAAQVAINALDAADQVALQADLDAAQVLVDTAQDELDNAIATAAKALTSFTPVTLTQTGGVAGSDVQYANANAVISALPTNITVTLGDGSTAVVPVSWADTDTYNAGVAADYTFTATWGTLPAGVNNSGSLPAPTVEVTVAP